jgi:hypothetical protein
MTLQRLMEQGVRSFIEGRQKWLLDVPINCSHTCFGRFPASRMWTSSLVGRKTVRSRRPSLIDSSHE